MCPKANVNIIYSYACANFMKHLWLLQDKEEQWMTKLVPGVNDFVLLQPLQWNTQYEVEITARNVKGLSEPTFVKFSMPQKPDITGTRTSTKHAEYSVSFPYDKLSPITYSTSSPTHNIYSWNDMSPIIIICPATVQHTYHPPTLDRACVSHIHNQTCRVTHCNCFSVLIRSDLSEEGKN